MATFVAVTFSATPVVVTESKVVITIPPVIFKNKWRLARP